MNDGFVEKTLERLRLPITFVAMENKAEMAAGLLGQGYNCAQAVFVTYADRFGIDRETAMKLASSFGGGLGGMRQVCGAISGMSMVAGLYNGASVPGDKEAKKKNYGTVQFLAEEFRAQHGAIRCGQLLGLEPGLPDGMSKKPCTEYVRTCARLVEQHLLGPQE